MRVPPTIQMQRAENAAATLNTMLAYYGLYMDMEEMRSMCPASRNGTSPVRLAEVAEAYGLRTNVREASIDEIKRLKMPVVVHWKRRYYVVVKGFKHGRVSLSDSAKGEYDIVEQKFIHDYAGTVIELSPGPAFQKGGHPTSLHSLIKGRLASVKADLYKLLVINVIFRRLASIFIDKSI